MGQYEDVESRLIENRYRTLVPELGGYVSPDPLHARTLGQIAGVHAYSYVGARPFAFVDPMGLVALTPCVFSVFEVPSSVVSSLSPSAQLGTTEFNFDFSAGCSSGKKSQMNIRLGIPCQTYLAVEGDPAWSGHVAPWVVRNHEQRHTIEMNLWLYGNGRALAEAYEDKEFCSSEKCKKAAQRAAEVIYSSYREAVKLTNVFH